MKFQLCFLCFFLLGCNKNESYPDSLVFGHGGMGIDMGISAYHDNSLEAIQLALSLPTINGVEIDVRVSADGTLWLYHDNQLEAQTDGEGCVNEKTDAQLAQIRYRSLHREKLVQLKDVWEFLGPDHMLIMELKYWNACSKSYDNLQRFKEAFDEIPLPYRSRIIIDCPNPHWLAELVQDFKVIYSTYSFQDGMKQLELVPSLAGLLMRNKDISAEQIAALKALNKEGYICEMRSSKKQRAALQKLPTAILADDPRGALVIRD
jgi:glycerophosphoryl diester phosphodiesterase